MVLKTSCLKDSFPRPWFAFKQTVLLIYYYTIKVNELISQIHTQKDNAVQCRVVIKVIYGNLLHVVIWSSNQIQSWINNTIMHLKAQLKPHIWDETVIWKHCLCGWPLNEFSERLWLQLKSPCVYLLVEGGGRMLECSCHNLATFKGHIMQRKTHLNKSRCQVCELSSWTLLIVRFYYRW